MQPSKIAQVLRLCRKGTAVPWCRRVAVRACRDRKRQRVARAFGNAWIRELRTAVLVVPSVIALRDGHALINPGHPDFKDIVAGTPEPVAWDARVFAAR